MIAGLCPAALGQQKGIGIRTVSGMPEFFDRSSNKKIFIRGNNYIRLAPQRTQSGDEILYHSTFNHGQYDTTQVVVALRKMQRGRYNVVRVFLNHLPGTGIGGTSGCLSQQYMDNVADFLRRAQACSMSVMLTIDWIPIPSRISSIEQLWCPDFQCTNAHVLSPEGLKANIVFFSTLIRELKRRKAPLESIFAYELRNELTFEPHLPPLSLSAGVVRAANGKTYDLSNPGEKKRLIDEGLVFWINKVRATIKAQDPGALVTVGFIPPKDEATSLAQEKLRVTTPAFQHSAMGFIDVHIYPVADGVTLEDFVEVFGLAQVKRKPVIVGELGALRQSYPSAEAAARDLRRWQAASRRRGFAGWILWAWDLHELPETYNAQDADGLIDRAMAPANRPDPGIPDSPEGTDRNIAFGKRVRASKQAPHQPAEMAVDGTAQPWSAGDFAPQWIEIDLLRPERIKMIRLMVSQNPAGETSHQIFAKGTGEDYRLISKIRQHTADMQTIEINTPDLTNIQFVKISTVHSPSWVGWREIEIIQ
jgi:hypothetical protein